jgi:hypothetical protein
LGRAVRGKRKSNYKALLIIKTKGKTMKDFIKCTYCDFIGTVEIGSERCPKCKKIGCLAWVDRNTPEVDEPDEKGTGGLWDLAGQIAEDYAVKTGKTFKDDYLQELIYNRVKYQLKQEG